MRFADFATVFPAGINAAATFSRSLIRARGYAMGQEFKGECLKFAFRMEITVVQARVCMLLLDL